MSRRLIASCLLWLPLTACGSSPAGPSGGGSTVLHGQTVSALDGAAAPNLSIQVGTRSVSSDGNGMFEVDPGGQGTHRALVRGSAVVERDTRVAVPKTDLLRVSMIPASFDLDAFNEMFRTNNSRLQRWTSRPSLVVLGSVMKYASGNLERFEATGERLTDDEVTALTNHLNEGLGLLTGGAYTSFASVDVEWPGAGEQVNVRRTGTIVVGRYSGIRNLAQTIGYGSWAEQPDGTVVGGAMWLDRDFDRDDPQRRLLRIHELGHALGYNHVTVRTSIMNPSLGPSPTDFDRAAASIAFQRPVGNVSPDTDPGSTARTFAVADGPARWSNPIR
jgi:hypothetical protein